MKLNMLPADLSELEFALSANWDQLAALGAEKNGTIHVKRGSPVLGVAHADTYGKWTGEWEVSKATLTAPTLDNRLGLWVLLFLLPDLDINVDVLITTGEENGASTAKEFKDKSYNWAISFDRGNGDTVLYHHDTQKWRSLLEGYGFNVGIGSFSDLSVLDIGVFGMNIGCGMKNYHSQQATADLWQLYDNVWALSKFYRDLRDVRLPSESPRPRHQMANIGYMKHAGGGYWDQEDMWPQGDSNYVQCPICGKWRVWTNLAWDERIKTKICTECEEVLSAHPKIKSGIELAKIVREN